MIEHIWSVLCSRSIIDVETNNVSIQNVIEQITINDEPKPGGFIPFPVELITLWGRKDANKPARGTERLSFVTPSGKILITSSEQSIDLSKADRYRLRAKFPGLPLSEAGRHYFRVELREDGGEYREAAVIPLTVLFQPQHERTSAS